MAAKLIASIAHGIAAGAPPLNAPRQQRIADALQAVGGVVEMRHRRPAVARDVVDELAVVAGRCHRAVGRRSALPIQTNHSGSPAVQRQPGGAEDGVERRRGERRAQRETAPAAGMGRDS